MSTAQQSLPACWICGSTVGLSHEHFPKKADTRQYFGRRPVLLFRTDAHQKNELVQGPGSDRLTLGAPICAHCNNSVTQPYDRAWDTTRDYLLSNWSSIVRDGHFSLLRVFAHNLDGRAVDLQLYFAKVLGCILTERNTSVDLTPFVDSILRRKANPFLRLLFADCEALHSKRIAYVSDMRVASDQQGTIQTAQLGYVLWPMSVQMIYTAPSSDLRPIPAAWHPLTGRPIVELGPAIGD
jgi:hypothetical protein